LAAKGEGDVGWKLRVGWLGPAASRMGVLAQEDITEGDRTRLARKNVKKAVGDLLAYL
jgi:hypothetical protein